jgi:hypothetical protein
VLHILKEVKEEKQRKAERYGYGLGDIQMIVATVFKVGIHVS